jgi:hypothetical protein
MNYLHKGVTPVSFDGVTVSVEEGDLAMCYIVLSIFISTFPISIPSLYEFFLPCLTCRTGGNQPLKKPLGDINLAVIQLRFDC